MRCASRGSHLRRGVCRTATKWIRMLPHSAAGRMAPFDCKDRHELCRQWAEAGAKPNAPPANPPPIDASEHARMRASKQASKRALVAVLAPTDDGALAVHLLARGAGECHKNPGYMVGANGTQPACPVACKMEQLPERTRIGSAVASRRPSPSRPWEAAARYRWCTALTRRVLSDGVARGRPQRERQQSRCGGPVLAWLLLLLLLLHAAEELLELQHVLAHAGERVVDNVDADDLLVREHHVPLLDDALQLPATRNRASVVAKHAQTLGGPSRVARPSGSALLRQAERGAPVPQFGEPTYPVGLEHLGHDVEAAAERLAHDVEGGEHRLVRHEQAVAHPAAGVHLLHPVRGVLADVHDLLLEGAQQQ
eukprot:scaffold3195_cov321-Prasinococcus_capsulatus_cf.AAC.5